MREDPSTNVGAWFAADARTWLYDMCEMVGLPRPPADDADRIANDTIRYVREKAGVAAPRIVARLREFRRRGLTLHVASGDLYDDLAPILDAMDARDLFDRVYGSDLLNVWKSSAAYYRALLDDTGVDSACALVIDDSERAIAWAAECGLRGVLVRRGADELFEDAVLRAFDEVERSLS